MTPALPTPEESVTVRLWASARAAAGAAEVSVPVPGAVTLAWLRDELVRRHERGDRLRPVLAVCSVLVGDRPCGSVDATSVEVRPGDVVEFLPPFAGG